SIVQTSQDGIIERINSEFTREFGYKEEECIGENIDKLIIPDSLKNEGSSFTKRAKENEHISVETYRKTKSGEEIFVSLLITPVRFNDETTSLFGIYRNITHRRRNSDLKDVILNISNAALTQSEIYDMFSNFQTEIGKLWNTTNFYIALYNEENETLSLPFYSDEKDRFDDIPTKGTLTGWLINTGKPNLLELPDIEILEDKGAIDLVGTPCKVWLGVPLTIDGNIIGAMVLQDYNDQKAFNNEDLRLLNLIGNQIALVIQRKEMMENLIIARRKAEDAARLKHEFMSTMSHEIRTPLNEVIGITNLLLQGEPRNDQMEFIKTLRFSGNHLLTLVNDVLDYNKMESGMIVFEKIQFSFIDFIKDLKRTYSFRTDEKGLDLIVDYDKKLPADLIGDPIRLNQILSNLVSNAIKFTNKGHIKVSISENNRDKKRINLDFRVEDTGIGIPDDKFETIFESYTQASEDTTRKFGGTGLGLAIVKRLIELQGSSIAVVSKQGKGSSFSFTLSFAIAAVKAESIETSELVEESYDQLIGKKVLIAEDNKINYFVASKFLAKWGIEVSHALNGLEAIDMIEKNKYDLILMDLHMPEMDGIEATKIIRDSKNSMIRELPVIALTAAIMSEHEEKIEDLNIQDYILKPFKPKELYDKILKYTR
ncbi:MAG: ATP-binding protein, partial [Bacteroidales bacterium]|nr:ATP-binding protein [Bacteroidales bacterium]